MLKNGICKYITIIFVLKQIQKTAVVCRNARMYLCKWRHATYILQFWHFARKFVSQKGDAEEERFTVNEVKQII